jgi:hypothetical protein
MDGDVYEKIDACNLLTVRNPTQQAINILRALQLAYTWLEWQQGEREGL